MIIANDGIPCRRPPVPKIQLTDKVSITVASYRRPRSILTTLASFLAQTYQNFEIIVAHSGSGPDVQNIVLGLSDPRITFMEIPRIDNDWGAHCREGAKKFATGQWLGTTNDDNYFEWMLTAAKMENADFVYCNMVHSISQWKAFDVAPHMGHIDAGGWLCKAEIVKNTPWPEQARTDSDGDYIVNRLLPKCNKAVKVPGFLFIHN
jgi:glycosyltransferase involved in cell wall biosynthesis